LEAPCAKGREGPLCGLCQPGFSPVILGNECVPGEDCVAYKWIIPVVLVASGVIVTGVAFTYKDVVSTDAPTVVITLLANPVIYFYQIAPLLLDDVVLHDVKTAATVVTSVFSASFGGDEATTGTSGFCLAPDMTGVQRVLVNVGPPVAMLLWLVILAMLSFLTHRIQGRRHHHLPGGWRGVVASFFFVVEFCYGTIIQTLFLLMYCVPLERDRHVLWVSGHVSCPTSWHPGVYIAAAALGIVPFSYLVFAWRLPCDSTILSGAKGKGKRVIWQSLCLPYKHSGRYNVGQPLFRRLLLLSVSAFVEELSREYLLFVLCLVFLAADTWVRPFRHSAVWIGNAIAHCCLVVLSAGHALIAVYPVCPQSTPTIADTRLQHNTPPSP